MRIHNISYYKEGDNILHGLQSQAYEIARLSTYIRVCVVIRSNTVR